MKNFSKLGGILFIMILTEGKLALGQAAIPKPGVYVTCRGLYGSPLTQGNSFELEVNRSGHWNFRTNGDVWHRAGNCRYGVLGEAPTDFGVSCTLHHPPTSDWMYRTTHLTIYREKNPISKSRIYVYDDLDPSSSAEPNREEILADLSGSFRACHLTEW